MVKSPCRHRRNAGLGRKVIPAALAFLLGNSRPSHAIELREFNLTHPAPPIISGQKPNTRKVQLYRGGGGAGFQQTDSNPCTWLGSLIQGNPFTLHIGGGGRLSQDKSPPGESGNKQTYPQA